MKMKVKKSAFKYLVSKIKSKGKEMKYKSHFQCQGCLKPNSILTLHDQRTKFSFRARMIYLTYNFQENRRLQYCKCESLMTNSHLYDCKILNHIERKVPYNRLFEGRLCEMKYIVNILMENQKNLELFTLAQDSSSLSH